MLKDIMNTIKVLLVLALIILIVHGYMPVLLSVIAVLIAMSICDTTFLGNDDWKEH